MDYVVLFNSIKVLRLDHFRKISLNRKILSLVYLQQSLIIKILFWITLVSHVWIVSIRQEFLRLGINHLFLTFLYNFHLLFLISTYFLFIYFFFIFINFLNVLERVLFLFDFLLFGQIRWIVYMIILSASFRDCLFILVIFLIKQLYFLLIILNFFY